MGYNTRKISLSLSDLGVQLPGHHSAARSANKIPPSAAAATTTTTTPNTAARSASTSSTAVATQQDATKTAPAHNSPPTKRIKRSHTVSAVSSTAAQPTSPARSRPRKSSVVEARRRHSGAVGETTPPPSPKAQSASRLDYEGINDDVVIAVLEQLEATGNRPHLIKEFAALFATKLPCVETSANPTAIITSRLTSYIKRPWTALAPCPLTKEQVQTHPRRVYYFLSTQPRQAIPEYVEPPTTAKRIISPSISSGPDEEETMESVEAARRQLSPSPELDFSTHAQVEEDLPHDQTMSFSQTEHTAPNRAEDSMDHTYTHRSASPPLEYDEREFTRTASSIFQRKESEQAEAAKQREAAEEEQRQRTDSISASTSAAATPGASDTMIEILPALEEESDEKAAMRNSEAAAALFGQSSTPYHFLAATNDEVGFGSSPMLRPQKDHPPLVLHGVAADKSLSGGGGFKRSSGIMEGISVGGGMDDGFGFGFGGGAGGWNELKSPEHVDLRELEDLLGGY